MKTDFKIVPVQLFFGSGTNITPQRLSILGDLVWYLVSFFSVSLLETNAEESPNGSDE
jgi:hypothetical protein